MRSDEINLQCDELETAQDFYAEELGFRLDMIYPADNPRVAVLSGYGILLRLRQIGASEVVQDEFEPAFVVQKNNGQNWGDGRAGMQYRDLVPHRLGGKYIASHIRIPIGGPVPDYVHYHNIRFQLIYCYRGWVRVVYEDQGDPFVMHAGDCVLQPPHIRHRVLECSDAMEVVEIAGPAEHETHVEHILELPTATVEINRDFSGQRFVFHQAEHGTWEPAAIDGFAARNTGIMLATEGIVSAVVFRSVDATDQVQVENDQEFCFNFVLTGSATLHATDTQPAFLDSGDSFLVPQNRAYSLSDISSGFEVLQVTASG
jgi:mannose-6-phosphate isomerase-like protein (cupin superfamily)